MPMDFPSSPTVGQLSNGYVWDGTAWNSTSAQPISLSTTALGDNQVINGGMDIWQRATSSGWVNGYQTADRWYQQASASTSWSRDSSVTAGGCQYSLKATVGAGAATVSLFQAIETANAISFAGQTVTLSAYMATSTSASVGIILEYSTSVDNALIGSWTAIATTPVSTTSTMARYSASFAVPSTAKSLRVNFTSTSALAANATFNITGVQLEAGSTATAFRRNAPSIAGELAACQRYYQRWTSVGAYTPITGNGFATSGTGARVHIYPLVSFRANPTSVEFANIGVYNVSGVQVLSSVTLVTPTTNVIAIDGTTSGLSTNQYVMLYSTGGGSGYIGINAEL